jgi:hypothetical protein
MLTPADRASAPCIFKALAAAKDDALSGRVTAASALQQQITATVEGALRAQTLR